VRLAVDVNFVEIFERCPNVKKLETELKQNEEKQRDQDGRNECEDYFFDEMASGFFTAPNGGFLYCGICDGF
jgi:hypothetical protein